MGRGVLDDFVIEGADLLVGVVDVAIELLLHALVVVEHGPAVSGVEVVPLACTHDFIVIIIGVSFALLVIADLMYLIVLGELTIVAEVNLRGKDFVGER